MLYFVNRWRTLQTFKENNDGINRSKILTTRANIYGAVTVCNTKYWCFACIILVNILNNTLG